MTTEEKIENNLAAIETHVKAARQALIRGRVGVPTLRAVLVNVVEASFYAEDLAQQLATGNTPTPTR